MGARAELTPHQTLHAVFSPSAAGGLRKALADLGRSDQVVALFDDLSFGPIDPPDPDKRARWVNGELGWTNWDDLKAKDAIFWRQVLSDQPRRVAWFSRRSTQDFAGFLEYVWRLGEMPSDVIDLTNAKVIWRDSDGEHPTQAPLGTLGRALPHQIVESSLLSLACDLNLNMRENFRAIWSRLRAENAPLRVLAANLELVSAPLSHFDLQLLDRIPSDEWKSGAIAVGEMLAAFGDEGRYQTGDLVLASRLAALADEGKIDATGDLPSLKGSRVRLALPLA